MKHKGLNFKDRLRLYEIYKRKISKENLTSGEYACRVVKLARKLNV